MYIYRHKRTGAEFSSPTPCKGKDWEEVKKPEKAEKTETRKRGVKK